MFEYFFLIIWHVGKPKEPKKGTLKILPQNLNPPPGGPLCNDKDTQLRYIAGKPLDFSVHRGGLKLEEEFKKRSSASRLTVIIFTLHYFHLKSFFLAIMTSQVTKLTISDSGDFTCSPSGAANATVTVKVEVKKTISFFSSKGHSLTQASWTLLVLVLSASFK